MYKTFGHSSAEFGLDFDVKLVKFVGPGAITKRSNTFVLGRRFEDVQDRGSREAGGVLQRVLTFKPARKQPTATFIGVHQSLSSV